MKINIDKNKINIENLLCAFIIICPILDILSFAFRNSFNFKFSPSTFLRPIIPIIAIIYLFIKKDKKFKKTFLGVTAIYIIYGIIHIFLFSKQKTGISYSNELHEIQYLINYTFMVLNLFLYIYIFKNENINKLKKSVLISVVIYIVSIYISIITKTSSSTYIEGIGFKGWFESGNSISAILLLSMFIYLPYLKEKKYLKVVITTLILVGIYLCIFIGTRAGLYGFILITILFFTIETVVNTIKSKKINKKNLLIVLLITALIFSVLIVFGSTTTKRRNYLKEIESNIKDETNMQNSHITGSLLEIKEKIENNEIENNYMSEEQQKSVMDLYKIANKFNVKNNDQRTQQLIYNIMLVKNQKNPILILFGNGYMANFRELVFEMEVLAILINFGIIGFILYLGGYIAILIYAIYKGIKNYNKISGEYIFLIFGALFSFAMSLFSGYTFFNSSSMMIIIAIYTCLLCTTKNIIKCNENERIK